MNSHYISHLRENQDSIINFIFILVLAYTGAIFFGRDVFADPDSGWHIKAGEIIWKTLSIPSHDTLTFTSDQQWYNLSWAWDVLVYLTYNTFHKIGLQHLQALLFTLSIASIYAVASSFKNFNVDTKAVITALGSLLIWDVLYLRPQLFSYVLAAIMLILLDRRKYTYSLPFIALVWANIHGSFIIMYTVFFAFILEAIYEKNYSWLKTLIMVTLFSSIAFLLNPIGYKIFIGVSRTLDSAITSYINEWMPFTFGREYGASMVIMILIITGGFADVKIPISHRVLAFIWVVAALTSRRSFGFLGVLAIPYLGYVLNALIAKSPSQVKLGAIYKIGLIGILTALVIFSPLLKGNIRYFQDDNSKVPYKAIDFINANCSKGKIFNDYNIGGYLALGLKDDIKYFIDGRAGTAFSEDLIKKYLSASSGASDISGLLKSYPVNIAIISNEFIMRTSYNNYFANWKIIYKDEKVSIYQSRGSKICTR